MGAVEQAVRRLAERQQRLARTRQLLDAGLTRHRLATWTAQERLVPVARGLHGIGGRPTTPDERAMAAVLLGGERAALGLVWAAWLHGWAPRPATPPDVVAPGGSRRDVDGLVRFHRARRLGPGDSTVVRGIPVTRPARTCLDCAEHADERTAERVLHEALVARRVTEAALRDELRRARGRHGAAVLARLLDAGDAARLPTRSEGERELRRFLDEAGLRRPTRTNAVVAGRERDAIWDDLGLVLEVDGFAAHGTSRASFEDDRERDLPLLGLGLVVVRVTWRMLRTRRPSTAAHLAAAMVRAERGPGG